MNGSPVTQQAPGSLVMRSDAPFATSPMSDEFGVLIESRVQHERLDDLSARDIWPLYSQHGAVLIRGFHPDTAAFDRFTSQFIAEFVVNGSIARADVAPDRGIQTVNSGYAPIPLHAEMAYSPFRPDLLCFHCMQQPAPGTGETLLCDGIHLWNCMPPNLKDTFGDAFVRYSMRSNRMIAVQAHGHIGRLTGDARVRLFRLNQDGTSDLDFVTPAVLPTRHGHAPAFANSVIVEAESASLEGIGPIDPAVRQELFVVSNALAYRLAWRTGDVLLVDNSRIMHGRRKIAVDDGRRIAIRMGWDKPLWQS